MHSGVTTDPADPALRGAAGLWGPKIMALVSVTVNLTQQFCADVHWHSFVATVEISRIHTT